MLRAPRTSMVFELACANSATLAAIGIAEPQSAESVFDEDNAAQDVGSTSKARFGPRDLSEGKTSLTQYPKILHAEYPLGEAFDIADEAQSENDAPN